MVVHSKLDNEVESSAAVNIDMVPYTTIQRDNEVDHPRKHKKDHLSHISHDQHVPEKHPQHQHRDQKALAQKSFDIKSIDVEKLKALTKTPLPAGLTFPKELSLEQLKHIIDEFH